VQANKFTGDEKPPKATGFEIDMDKGEMQLFFEQPVDGGSVAIVHLKLQSTQAGGTSVALRKKSTASSDLSVKVLVTFSPDDLNEIKKQALCTKSGGKGSCFLSFSDKFVKDSTGLTVAAVAASSALASTKYTADNTAPNIVAKKGFATFDLNKGRITLDFDEVINRKSFEWNNLTLANDDEKKRADHTHKLTGGKIVETSDETTLTIEITPGDLNKIKENTNLCSTRQNCHLAAAAGMFKDFADNGLVATADEEYMRPNTFTPDTTKPELEKVDIDMNKATVTLSFSETVDVSALVRGAVTLQDARGGSKNVTLESCTDSAVCSSSADGTEVVISITDTDMNAIKLLQFATKASDLFVSITDKAIVDMEGSTPNKVLAVASSNAVVATGYKADQKPPSLVQFGFDLETGKLSMTFSEPVKPGLFAMKTVTLQGKKDISNDNKPSKLLITRGTVVETATASMTVTVSLHAEDVVAIKSDTGMYSKLSDTYLSLEEGAVVDMAGLKVKPVLLSAALQASVHGEDKSRGSLQKYELDWAKRQLTLYFNEVVDVNTYQPGEMTIMSGKTKATSESYRLVGNSSVVGTADTATVVLQLSRADHVKLGEKAKLATSTKDTYIMMTAGTGDDVLQRDLLAITDGSGVQVSKVVPDVTPPKITQAVVDLDNEKITITFSEPIKKDSFKYREITLQSDAKSVATTTTRPLNETKGVAFNGARDVVTITLSTNDLNAIKLDDKLAVNGKVYIRHSDKLVLDLQGVKVAAVDASSAFSATLSEDKTSPQLVGFGINMDTGKIIVTFAEPVRAQSFNATKLTIQDAATASESYTLKGGAESTTNGLELTVTMTVDDLVALKKKSMASGKTDTYMTLTADAVTDMAGVKVAPVVDGKGVIASAFASDGTKPTLDSFSLDMTKSELVMTFSETVLAAKSVLVDNKQFTLQSAKSSKTAGAVSYTLTGGDVSTTDSTKITLTLSPDDMNAIKKDAKLATKQSDTFLAMTADAIKDVSQNQAVALTTDQALGAKAYAKDGTKPKLSAFSVDMDGGKIALTFTETVSADDVKGTAITLQSAANIATTNATKYLLKGVESKSKADSTIVTITLNKTDLDVIKANTKLLVSEATSYASVTTSLALDMQGNQVEAIASSSALKVSKSQFKKDITPPTVTKYDLDLDSGKLNVVVSEPVSSVVDVTAITLCSGSENQNYTLTDATKFSLSKDQMQVAMVLGDHDLDQIKARYYLATNTKSTLLTLTSTFAQDTNNNAVEPLAKADKITPSNFNTDATQPRLVSYVLDLNTNELILTFSEAVNSTSIDLSGITLQDAANSTAATSSYSLTGGNVFVPQADQCPLDGN